MKPKTNRETLILDGGGSSLKVYLRTDSGLELKARHDGDFNWQTGKRPRIIRALSNAMTRFPVKRAMIGLAGVVSPKDKAFIRALFAERRVRAMSDLELAFELHFPNQDGIVVILGTGSIFAAKLGGRVVKIGGYGRAIGDAGSGYAIGQEATRKFLQSLDGFFRDEIFLAAMKRTFRSKNDAIRKVYQEGFALQTLAPVVFECAENGSPLAIDIVENQISNVARYIERLREASDSALPVRLLGGLLERETIYSRRLLETLRRANVKLQPCDYGASPSFPKQ